MKTVLLSISIIFTILFTMASCQSLGAQGSLGSYDIRSEIVYNEDVDFEEQVSSLIAKANGTSSMVMKKAEMN